MSPNAHFTPHLKYRVHLKLLAIFQITPKENDFHFPPIFHIGEAKISLSLRFPRFCSSSSSRFSNKENEFRSPRRYEDI